MVKPLTPRRKKRRKRKAKTDGFSTIFLLSDAPNMLLGLLGQLRRSLRYGDLRLKHIVLLVFLIYLYLHLTSDTPTTSVFVGARPNSDNTDQLLSLQAEIGYLRKKLAKCSNSVTGSLANSKIEHFTPIFVITPTYTRAVQKAELTRLASVFVMVPNLHWIIVEDSPSKTTLGQTS